jgi:hypothetical protein
MITPAIYPTSQGNFLSNMLLPQFTTSMRFIHKDLHKKSPIAIGVGRTIGLKNAQEKCNCPINRKEL